MIFITLGSQKFQFNRLLQSVDELIDKGVIKEEVFAQIGYSDYTPINYEYKDFLDRDEFSKQVEKCEILITHGGTGAIISAVIYGCMNVLIELVMGTVKMMILGNGLAAAIAGSVISIPATVINAVFMVIAIAILYQPVKKVYGRIS